MNPDSTQDEKGSESKIFIVFEKKTQENNRKTRNFRNLLQSDIYYYIYSSFIYQLIKLTIKNV